MADIFELLKRKALEQYAKGQPYRDLFFKGDPTGVMQNLKEFNQKAQTPEGALDVALNFAPLGITAFHGTPHEIIGNKFDLSKIGTGEGAQAYGYGLYFAESPAVAKTYQMPSRGAEATAAYHLKMYKTPQNAIAALEDQLGSNITELGRQHTQEAINLLKSGKATTGNLYKVDIADETIPRMLEWDKPLSSQSKEVKNVVANLAKQTNTWNNYYSQLNPKAQKLANDMLSGNKPIVGSDSAKYWKQLDKLNPNVDHNAIFDSLYETGLRSGQRDVTGSDLYNALTRKLSNENYLIQQRDALFKKYQKEGMTLSDAVRAMTPEDRASFSAIAEGIGNAKNAPAMASKYLLESGVPGIKYFDAASRVGNEGTKNYVVFDPEIVKILERKRGLLAD